MPRVHGTGFDRVADDGFPVHREESISLSLDVSHVAFLPPAQGAIRSDAPFPYAHTDIVIKLPSIPTNYVAFVSPTGSLGMMRSPLREDLRSIFFGGGNALIAKLPPGFADRPSILAARV